MNLGSSSLGSVELGGVNDLAAIIGTLGITLADQTLSGAGAVSISGSITTTLSGQTFSGAGSILISGSISSTLASVTNTFSGGVIVGGTLSQTLSSITETSSGSVLISGALSGGPTQTMSGTGLVGSRMGQMLVTLDDIQFRFRGKVTGARPIVIEPSSACLSFDAIKEIDGLESDDLLDGTGITFDNILDGGANLQEDAGVEVPCNN